MTDLVQRLRDLRERFIFQGGSEFALSLADRIQAGESLARTVMLDQTSHDAILRSPGVQGLAQLGRNAIDRVAALEAANVKLVGALDMIRESLNGGNVEDLLLIINDALEANRSVT